MPTYTTLANRTITTVRELGKGGEGRVYEVSGRSDLVAKIYHQSIRNVDRERKLQAMIINPPQDDTRSLSPPHVSIAWPTDLLYEQGRFAGYLMPRLSQSPDIFEIYNPQMRAKKYPTLDWRHLHRVAKNLATALNALHSSGYVMGDVNQKNVLVTGSALVTLVDTDSFQVRGSNGNVFRCSLGVPEYTPPELHRVRLDSVDRVPAQDHFGLGVVIFQLLMEGFHPFTGAPKDPTMSVVGEIYLHCIKAGIFPYEKNRDFAPPPDSPAFTTLHPELQKTFLRCFIDGYKDPSARPTAREWINILGRAEAELAPCKKNSSHYYSTHNKRCQWCEREAAKARTRTARAIQPPVQTRIPPATPPPLNLSRPRPSAGTLARTMAVVVVLAALGGGLLILLGVVRSFIASSGGSGVSSPSIVVKATVKPDKISRGRTADEKVNEFVLVPNQWVETSLLIKPNQEVLIHHFASNESVTANLGGTTFPTLQKAGTLIPLYTSSNCSADPGVRVKNVTYYCVQLTEPESIKLFASSSVRVGILIKPR